MHRERMVLLNMVAKENSIYGKCRPALTRKVSLLIRRMCLTLYTLTTKKIVTIRQ